MCKMWSIVADIAAMSNVVGGQLLRALASLTLSTQQLQQQQAYQTGKYRHWAATATHAISAHLTQLAQGACGTSQVALNPQLWVIPACNRYYTPARAE